MGIKEEMPLLARHEGEWHGTYTYVDTDAKVTDHHESIVTCAFPSEGEFPYFQTNRYKWEDGREQFIEFPASYSDRKIHFDTDRLKGYAWEVDDRTIVLTWTYRSNPGEYLYEMIQLDDSGTNRTRTWHWFRDGICYQRTLINERKVS
jgi:hypothetical protein